MVGIGFLDLSGQLGTSDGPSGRGRRNDRSFLLLIGTFDRPVKDSQSVMLGNHN